jgi:hypothetical protein
MVRASALARLAAHPGAATLAVARDASTDTRPTVRLYALQALENADLKARLDFAPSLLSDPRRAVRQEAAWIVAPATESLSTRHRAAFDSATRELIGSQLYNADRAPSVLRLATFLGEVGRYTEAAAEVRAAERLDANAARRFVQALTSAAASNASAAEFLRAINATRR